MFRSDLATYSNVSMDFSYGQNLARAARTFLAALLAIDPSEVKMGAARREQSRDDGIAEMLKLARQFDASQPNQAAELRYLAGRDIF